MSFFIIVATTAGATTALSLLAGGTIDPSMVLDLMGDSESEFRRVKARGAEKDADVHNPDYWRRKEEEENGTAKERTAEEEAERRRVLLEAAKKEDDAERAQREKHLRRQALKGWVDAADNVFENCDGINTEERADYMHGCESIDMKSIHHPLQEGDVAAVIRLKRRDGGRGDGDAQVNRGSTAQHPATASDDDAIMVFEYAIIMLKANGPFVGYRYYTIGSSGCSCVPRGLSPSGAPRDTPFPPPHSSIEALPPSRLTRAALPSLRPCLLGFYGIGSLSVMTDVGAYPSTLVLLSIPNTLLFFSMGMVGGGGAVAAAAANGAGILAVTAVSTMSAGALGLGLTLGAASAGLVRQLYCNTLRYQRLKAARGRIAAHKKKRAEAGGQHDPQGGASNHHASCVGAKKVDPSASRVVAKGISFTALQQAVSELSATNRPFAGMMMPINNTGASSSTTAATAFPTLTHQRSEDDSTAPPPSSRPSDRCFHPLNPTSSTSFAERQRELDAFFAFGPMSLLNGCVGAMLLELLTAGAALFWFARRNKRWWDREAFPQLEAERRQRIQSYKKASAYLAARYTWEMRAKRRRDSVHAQRKAYQDAARLKGPAAVGPFVLKEQEDAMMMGGGSIEDGFGRLPSDASDDEDDELVFVWRNKHSRPSVMHLLHSVFTTHKVLPAIFRSHSPLFRPAESPSGAYWADKRRRGPWTDVLTNPTLCEEAFEFLWSNYFLDCAKAATESPAVGQQQYAEWEAEREEERVSAFNNGLGDVSRVKYFPHQCRYPYQSDSDSLLNSIERRRMMAEWAAVTRLFVGNFLFLLVIHALLLFLTEPLRRSLRETLYYCDPPSSPSPNSTATAAGHANQPSSLSAPAAEQPAALLQVAGPSSTAPPTIRSGGRRRNKVGKKEAGGEAITPSSTGPSLTNDFSQALSEQAPANTDSSKASSISSSANTNSNDERAMSQSFTPMGSSGNGSGVAAWLGREWAHIFAAKAFLTEKLQSKEVAGALGVNNGGGEVKKASVKAAAEGRSVGGGGREGIAWFYANAQQHQWPFQKHPAHTIIGSAYCDPSRIHPYARHPSSYRLFLRRVLVTTVPFAFTGAIIATFSARWNRSLVLSGEHACLKKDLRRDAWHGVNGDDAKERVRRE